MVTAFDRLQIVYKCLQLLIFVLSLFAISFRFRAQKPMSTTHYCNSENLYDGNIMIFQRGDAVSKEHNRVWQARFRLDGNIGYKHISLKTKNRDEAVAKAKSKYHLLCQSVKEGGSLQNKTFERAWKDWYSFMLSENVWADDRKRWHRQHFNRYFNAYFGAKKLDEITAEVANGYWNWRKRYWIDGAGVNQITYNRQRAGLKTHSTHNAKKPPAYKTLRMEQSALNQFFEWCFSTKRYIRYPIKLKVVASKKSKNEGRRGTFTNTEWRALTTNLINWAAVKGKYTKDQVSDWHRHHRQQLRFYILFLANTGIRPGTETRFMQWEDIEFREDNLKIRIRHMTKVGGRDVISQPSAVEWMKQWKQISRYNGHQDYVWYGSSKKGDAQNTITDLNKTFQKFLKGVGFHGRKDGLLFDSEGKRRSLYSLRHFYATQRLKYGVTYVDLAKNMGTGIEQLTKHYDWVTTEERAVEITKTNFKNKKPVVDIDQLVARMTEQQREDLRKKLLNESPAEK